MEFLKARLSQGRTNLINRELGLVMGSPRSYLFSRKCFIHFPRSYSRLLQQPIDSMLFQQLRHSRRNASKRDVPSRSLVHHRYFSPSLLFFSTAWMHLQCLISYYSECHFSLCNVSVLITLSRYSKIDSRLNLRLYSGKQRQRFFHH